MRTIPRAATLTKLADLNPHWKLGQIEERVAAFRRRGYFDLLYPLVAQTTAHRAVILMGPRRVGKTVLLHQLMGQLINDGVPPKRIVYVALDMPLLQRLSLEDLTQRYLEVQDQKTLDGCTVIFDEIQYLPDWHRHLKVLVDAHRTTRFIASGSAAAALRLRSLESGAGRFTEFNLPPLTFYEYVDLLGLHEKVASGGNVAALNEEFVKYINYGGFPEAVFDESIQRDPERFIRSDIIEKVLLKDLPSLYGIRDTLELNDLFNTLAFQTAGEVSYSELSKNSGVAMPTLKKYIEYLEAAFLIRRLRRLGESGRRFKRENFFKVYLSNPSMYGALFRLVTADDEEMGALAETAMMSQFLHMGGNGEIHYARSSGGNVEVDLVGVDNRQRMQLVLEVKWSDRYIEHPNELTSLLRFCKQANQKRAFVTTRSTTGRREIGGVEIHFFPTSSSCYVISKNILAGKLTRLQDELSRIAKAAPE
jgi:predicted AAA+ superfamily ATPase